MREVTIGRAGTGTVGTVGRAGATFVGHNRAVHAVGRVGGDRYAR